MSTSVSGINPEILRWARQLAGLSPNEVAAKLKKDVGTIEAWEAGTASPTYVQLEKLAYEVYNRPIALFFFPECPEEVAPEQSFRTLPDFEISRLSPDTRYRIRDAQSLQVALYELHGGHNPAERKVFRDLSVDPARPVADTAAQVRAYLGVSVEEQRGWRTNDEALGHWRAAIEDVGVYVFKNTFEQRGVSGFCLYDPEFPVIYINNSTAKARQIFTLFHELAHVLLGASSVTKADDEYIQQLGAEEKRIEIFCNRFAAEFLVPEASVRARIRGATVDVETASTLASEYHVSREFMYRRFLDMGLVSPESYTAMAGKWNQEFEEARAPAGGNYYNTQAAYLGDKYLELAFGRYYQGAISHEQLADYLGVKARNVSSLEQTYLRRAAR